uniref:Adaptor protein ClpS core domain-containing protein n=1 Tax=Aegilops tauschii subsp. strangulata TaxID=200361 RepID=A0A453FV70_AEGTS
LAPSTVTQVTRALSVFLVSSPLRDLTRNSRRTQPYIRFHGDQQQSCSLYRTRFPEHHRRRPALERLREPESSAEEGGGSRGPRDQRWRRGAGPAGLRPVPARHPSPSTRRRRHGEAQGPQGHRQRRQLQGAAPRRPAPHREARYAFSFFSSSIDPGSGGAFFLTAVCVCCAVETALPQVVPSVTAEAARQLFHESRQKGAALVIVAVKEHAEFYAQMMVRHGLRSAIEPESDMAS